MREEWVRGIGSVASIVCEFKYYIKFYIYLGGGNMEGQYTTVYM